MSNLMTFIIWQLAAQTGMGILETHDELFTA